MSQVVLDSGVFIAAVYVETLTSQAKRLLKWLQDEDIVLHATEFIAL